MRKKRTLGQQLEDAIKEFREDWKIMREYHLDRCTPLDWYNANFEYDWILNMTLLRNHCYYSVNQIRKIRQKMKEASEGVQLKLF